MHIYNLEELFCKVRGSCIKVMLPDLHYFRFLPRTGLSDRTCESVSRVKQFAAFLWWTLSPGWCPLNFSHHSSLQITLVLAGWGEELGFLGSILSGWRRSGYSYVLSVSLVKEVTVVGVILGTHSLSRRVTWAKWNCSSYPSMVYFWILQFQWHAGVSPSDFGSNKDVRICGWLQK